ncbi:MAG: DNA cytosine methyltransferase [Hymenobacter sp.]|nr:MAG: DNA cytosine methyltransferase [Hymenobacter sp.]
MLPVLKLDLKTLLRAYIANETRLTHSSRHVFKRIIANMHLKESSVKVAIAPTDTSPNPVLGDLFSGAGGFSLGAHLAGFDAAFAVDCDPDLTSSYNANFPNTKLILAKLGEVSAGDIMKLSNIRPRQLDGIIGGPPCQGFSVMGHRDANDPRNSLLGVFFEFVAYAEPAFFVMENVPNIMAKQYQELLETGISKISAQYQTVGPFLVDAARFGVATKRKRAILIGYDSKRVSPITEADIRALETDDLTTVFHAIHDLPDPDDDDDNDGWHEYKSQPEVGNVGDYARRARLARPSGLINTNVSPATFGADERVSGLQKTVHSDRLITRMTAMTPGIVDPTSKAKRLRWDETCTVLRAGTGKERGSHQAVRPIHPDKPRVITVREAARIQGFPDWFQFHEAKWHSFRMIGNSVSPILAEAILKLIKSRLR